MSPRDGDPDATKTGARVPARPEVVAAGDAATDPASASARRPDGVIEIAPRRIGRFQVLERAGKGAMGIVYAAYDAELDRKVAIKVLLADAASAPDYAERLKREARAMARVVHPNVVAVHDVGVHERCPFIAMDFVQGSDLRTHLAKQRPHWRSVVELFLQAGEGLAAAHAVDVVHRDFKPDNVLVAERRAGDRARGFVARVADFGLASAAPTILGAAALVSTGAAASEQTLRSYTGAGTPAYMAPERWAEKPATPATDQFSFCVALFEALAGFRPFVAETLPELAVAITTGARKPIPDDTDAPRWLWRIVERGLAADPGLRHPSMEVLLAALAADPRRRNRRLALGAAALVVVGGLIGARQIALARARSACADRADASIATVWGEERRDVVARAFGRVGTPAADEAWSIVEGRLSRYTDLLGRAERQLCELHEIEHGIPDDMFVLRSGCLELRRLEGEVFAIELEGIDASTISFAAEAARFLSAVGDCSDVRRLLEDPPLPEDPDQRERVVELQRRLLEVRVRQQLGRQASALPLAEGVVKEAEAVDHRPILSRALLALGTAQSSVGDVASAEASLSRAIEVAAEAHDAGDEAGAWVLLLWVAGRRDSSRVADLVRGATAAIDRMGSSGQLRARLETIRGSLEAEAGDYERAIDHHERSLALWQSLPDDIDVELARVHNNLGWTYHMMERVAEAREHYESSLRLKEAVLGSGNPQLATTLHNLGMLAREQKELATARAQLERALTLTIAGVGPDHPRVANVLSELAATLVDLGESRAAIEAATRGLAILQAAGSPNPALAEQLNAELQRATTTRTSP